MAYDLSIAQQRFTKAQFAATNPVPSAGQLCVETDSGTYATGDGTSAYLTIRGNTLLSGSERQSADDVYAAMGLSDGRDETGGPSGPVSTDDVTNDSAVTGATATAALNALNTAVNTKGEIINSGTRQDVMYVHTDQADSDGRITANLALASGDMPALASAQFVSGSGGTGSAAFIVGREQNTTLATYTVEFWDIEAAAKVSVGTQCTFTVVGVRA